MRTQSEKAIAFRALHERPRAFIIPNPWDLGTARVLAYLGYEALATTSAGCALTLGCRDYGLSRAQVIDHIRAIAGATDLPVSADLENGFGDSPEKVAETIRLAAEAGVVGGSIEDSTRTGDAVVYDRGLARERIQAAVEAARRVRFPFTLTARAENFLVGRPDLEDTIARLQAYQEAGADVLYAPGLVKAEDIQAVVSSVDRPLNVLIGIPGDLLSADQLSALGVRRISVGSGLSRAAFGAFLRAAREMRDSGTFRFTTEALGAREINSML
jgi:2-methylisocitrate lyase-like PEP mutase family enzyme